jgi:hypothetical protein
MAIADVATAMMLMSLLLCMMLPSWGGGERVTGITPGPA